MIVTLRAVGGALKFTVHVEEDIEVDRVHELVIVPPPDTFQFTVPLGAVLSETVTVYCVKLLRGTEASPAIDDVVENFDTVIVPLLEAWIVSPLYVALIVPLAEAV